MCTCTHTHTHHARCTTFHSKTSKETHTRSTAHHTRNYRIDLHFLFLLHLFWHVFQKVLDANNSLTELVLMHIQPKFKDADAHTGEQDL
jgi:hypothetical protein